MEAAVFLQKMNVNNNYNFNAGLSFGEWKQKQRCHTRRVAILQTFRAAGSLTPSIAHHAGFSSRCCVLHAAVFYPRRRRRGGPVHILWYLN